MAEEKPNPTPEELRDAKLVEGIREGVRAAMPEVIKPFVERLSERERPAPQPQQPLAAIQRPTEEQLADALIDGNRAEYARLLRLQRAADDQQRRGELGQLSAQGGAAINSMAKLSAENLPHYKRFKKEIDGEIEKFVASNPGVILTPEHYSLAHGIVRDRHFDEIMNETVEERIRKAQEPEPAILPAGRAEEAPREPTTLAELLPGDWKEEYHTIKGRRWNEDTDRIVLEKLGYKSVQEFAQKIKDLNDLEEQFGERDTCGLDHDFDKTTGKWV